MHTRVFPFSLSLSLSHSLPLSPPHLSVSDGLPSRRFLEERDTREETGDDAAVRAERRRELSCGCLGRWWAIFCVEPMTKEMDRRWKEEGLVEEDTDSSIGWSILFYRKNFKKSVWRTEWFRFRAGIDNHGIIYVLIERFIILLENEFYFTKNCFSPYTFNDRVTSRNNSIRDDIPNQLCPEIITWLDKPRQHPPHKITQAAAAANEKRRPTGTRTNRRARASPNPICGGDAFVSSKSAKA